MEGGGAALQLTDPLKQPAACGPTSSSLSASQEHGWSFALQLVSNYLHTHTDTANMGLSDIIFCQGCKAYTWCACRGHCVDAWYTEYAIQRTLPHIVQRTSLPS